MPSPQNVILKDIPGSNNQGHGLFAISDYQPLEKMMFPEADRRSNAGRRAAAVRNGNDFPEIAEGSRATVDRRKSDFHFTTFRSMGATPTHSPHQPSQRTKEKMFFVWRGSSRLLERISSFPLFAIFRGKERGEKGVFCPSGKSGFGNGEFSTPR